MIRVSIHSWIKFFSLNLQATLENYKNLHYEILKFLNDGQINYKLFKKFIITGNENS